MATPNPLRKAVAELTRRAEADLAALWRQLDPDDARQVREALLDVLPALVDTYGAMAATVAADWYDELREEFGATRRFTAIPAEIPDAGAAGLVDWARGMAQDDAAFRTLVAGGLQKRIANGSRLTVTGSAIADPSAEGWMRIGSGSCAFCRMLIGRGAVYSEASADFASHDHCNCQAIPKFPGAQPVDVRAFKASSRNSSDADRARVRKWIASHDI